MRKAFTTMILAIGFIFIIGTRVKAATVDEYIALMPSNAQEYLNTHATVECKDKVTCRGYGGDVNVVGVTTSYIDPYSGSVYYNTIEIMNGYEDFILHEFGHLIDNSKVYHNYSNTDLFGLCFINEWYTNPNYCECGNYNLNASEYFAESVRQYFLHRDDLLRLNPNTYAYVNAIIEGLN